MLSVSYLRTLPFLVSTLFFLLSLLPTECRSQNQSKIDSLQRLLPGSDMLQQIDLKRAIAIQYVDYENERALQYMDSALQLATHSGDSFRIVKTARMKSAVLRRIGKR